MQIVEVRTPAVGDAKPSAVHADLVIDTRPLRGDVRSEWDEVKQHDVLFLLTVSEDESQLLTVGCWLLTVDCQQCMHAWLCMLMARGPSHMLRT